MQFKIEKLIEEDGTATVETAIWLPVLFMVFILIVNASFVFYKQSLMMRVVQDANRAFSVGRLASKEATQNYIVSRLANLSSRSSASTQVDEFTGVITSTASMPVTDMIFTGGFNLFDQFSVKASSQHFMEY